MAGIDGNDQLAGGSTQHIIDRLSFLGQGFGLGRRWIQGRLDVRQRRRSLFGGRFHRGARLFAPAIDIDLHDFIVHQRITDVTATRHGRPGRNRLGGSLDRWRHGLYGRIRR